MKVVRLKDVVKKTGMSKSTIWRLEKKGLFLKRCLIGIKAVGWIEGDIDSWIENRHRL